MQKLTLFVLLQRWVEKLNKRKWSIDHGTIMADGGYAATDSVTNEPVIIHLIYKPYSEKIDVIEIDTIENKAYGPMAGYDINNKWVDQKTINVTDPQFFKKLKLMMRNVEKEFNKYHDIVRKIEGHQIYYSIHRAEWRDECF